MTDTNRSPARYALFALPVLVAVAAAWWFTRGSAPAPAAAGHDHAAMAASSGGGPVVISAADARRIGVTFATATHATLRRDVQLAGEVVVDETRIRGVTLKVDGVVERLHADYVGKVIQRGEPVLALYSPMLILALWLPAFWGGAFGTFLLRQFFLTIPRDFAEAARVDGVVVVAHLLEGLSAAR